MPLLQCPADQGSAVPELLGVFFHYGCSGRRRGPALQLKAQWHLRQTIDYVFVDGWRRAQLQHIRIRNSRQQLKPSQGAMNYEKHINDTIDIIIHFYRSILNNTTSCTKQVKITLLVMNNNTF